MICANGDRGSMDNKHSKKDTKAFSSSGSGGSIYIITNRLVINDKCSISAIGGGAHPLWITNNARSKDNCKCDDGEENHGKGGMGRIRITIRNKNDENINTNKQLTVTPEPYIG